MLDSICKWKPTSKFPKYYMVSDRGDVFSKISNKVLKPAEDKYGYLYYVLCVNSERHTVKAHRLVAMAFVDNPYNKPTVDHIDGNKKNNSASNLRWATNKEQTNNENTKAHLDEAHRRTDYRAMGAKRNFGRKPVKITWHNGNEYIYPTLKQAAEAVGKSCGKLSEILNGKRNQDRRFNARWLNENL